MNIASKTKRIFDTDAYIKEYDAKVLSCEKSFKEGFEDCFEVITDATVFSPEGGGQKSDIGFFDETVVQGTAVFSFRDSENHTVGIFPQKFCYGKRLRSKRCVNIVIFHIF